MTDTSSSLLRAPFVSLPLALCILISSSPAHAQDLDGALALYLDAEFRAAEEAFEAVLGGDDIDMSTAAIAQAHLSGLAVIFDRDPGPDDRRRLVSHTFFSPCRETRR